MTNNTATLTCPNLIQFGGSGIPVTALTFREGVDVNDSISDVKVRQVKPRLGHPHARRRTRSSAILSAS